MKLISGTNGITKKELFNARVSFPLKGEIGKEITISKCAIVSDTDEDGNERKVSVFYLTDNRVVSSVSQVILDFAQDIIEMLDENPDSPITVMVDGRKANSGREYLTLIML